MLKIDVFSHILTSKYVENLAKTAPQILKTNEYGRTSMVDMDIRRDLMRRFPEVLQIITMGNIPLENYVDAKAATELAKIGNEELSDIVVKNPSLFYGAAGVLPMDDVGAAVDMIDYCIKDLLLLGVQVFSTVRGMPISDEKYWPIFEKMSSYDRPIWIHPCDNALSKVDFGMFSWPYETSICMLNLVKSGVFDKFPNLKFIVHHAGAMVPFFRERVRSIMPGRSYEQFKNFYVDTALYGNTAGLMVAYEYYGADHILFGTDSPMGAPHGSHGTTENTVYAIEQMAISESEKLAIFRENAIKMFKINL